MAGPWTYLFEAAVSLNASVTITPDDITAQGVSVTLDGSQSPTITITPDIITASGVEVTVIGVDAPGPWTYLLEAALTGATITVTPDTMTLGSGGAVTIEETGKGLVTITPDVMTLSGGAVDIPSATDWAEIATGIADTTYDDTDIVVGETYQYRVSSDGVTWYYSNEVTARNDIIITPGTVTGTGGVVGVIGGQIPTITITPDDITAQGVALTVSAGSTTTITASKTTLGGGTVTVTGAISDTVSINPTAVTLGGVAVTVTGEVEGGDATVTITPDTATLSGVEVTLTGIGNATVTATASAATLSGSPLTLTGIENATVTLTAGYATLNGGSVQVGAFVAASITITAGVATLASVESEVIADARAIVEAEYIRLAGGSATLRLGEVYQRKLRGRSGKPRHLAGVSSSTTTLDGSSTWES